MKRITRGGAIALALSLGTMACTPQIPVSDEPLDFTRHAAAPNPAPVQTTETIVRAYMAGAEDTAVEIGGAACTMKSSQFSLAFTTPARINIPRTKGRPEPLRLRCKAKGKGIDAMLAPQKRITSVGVNTGELLSSLVATAITTAVSTGASEAADVWVFNGDRSTLGIPLQ